MNPMHYNEHGYAGGGADNTFPGVTQADNGYGDEDFITGVTFDALGRVVGSYEYLAPEPSRYPVAGLPPEMLACFRLWFNDKGERNGNRNRHHKDESTRFHAFPSAEHPNENRDPGRYGNMPVLPHEAHTRRQLVDPKTAEDQERLDEFIATALENLIKKGPTFVRRILRALGYTNKEAGKIIKDMMMRLATDRVGVEVDEEKALAIERYDHMYAEALEAVDYRTALMILKQRDRVTGVVMDIDTSNPLDGLAAIAAAITRGDSAVKEARARVITVPSRMPDRLT